jgi:hypothetical protein
MKRTAEALDQRRGIPQFPPQLVVLSLVQEFDQRSLLYSRLERTML